jgi:molybdopterin molybdotransferase
MMGNPNPALNTVYRPLKENFLKKPGIAYFLKGFYNNTELRILGAQESYRLSSFAAANCLVYLKEESTEINQHEMVEAHIIPYA